MAALADRTSLQRRRARRLPAASARGHLAGPYPRARHPRVAEPGRDAERFRQGTRNWSARHLQGGGAFAQRTGDPRRLARDLILAAMQDKPFDVAGTVARLHEMVDDLCLGPSTASIVDAATERDIPSIRLTEGNLVQLGYGARQRRIWTAETDQTSAIAEGISRDKDLSKSLLSACGVPVPEGRVVESPEDAWQAAESIGVPVVVKPSDANHGRGVSIDLTTREEIEAAYHLADAEGSEVMVERFVRGNEHRLLVIGGKLAAAARGETIYLEADGKSTIRTLIDTQLNSDPRRGASEEFPLDVILVDENPAA